MTKLLVALVVLLGLALVAEALLESSVAAWAVVALVAVVLLVRYEFWPGRVRGRSRD